MSGSKNPKTSPSVTVHIVYRSKFKSLTQALERQFPKILNITNETSNDKKNGVVFEVYVNGAGSGSGKGQLIHSKLNGDGFVDSTEKMDKIFDAIRKLVPGATADPELKSQEKVPEKPKVPKSGSTPTSEEHKEDQSTYPATEFKSGQDGAKTSSSTAKAPRGRKRKEVEPENKKSSPPAKKLNTNTSETSKAKMKTRTQPKRGN